MRVFRLLSRLFRCPAPVQSRHWHRDFLCVCVSVLVCVMAGGAGRGEGGGVTLGSGVLTSRGHTPGHRLSWLICLS